MDDCHPISYYFTFGKNQMENYTSEPILSDYSVPFSGNLRNSKVTRKTLYGDKYDYGSKIKEKQNYVLYASGTLREKKEIEEIEQPLPQPTIVQEKEIIDNYKYHETKNIKRQVPNRISYTHHKRLSAPFERTYYSEITEDIPYKSSTIITKNKRTSSTPRDNRYKYLRNYETYSDKFYDYTPKQYIERNPFEPAYKSEKEINDEKYSINMSRTKQSFNDYTPIRSRYGDNNYSQTSDYRRFRGYDKGIRSASYNSDLRSRRYNKRIAYEDEFNNYGGYYCACGQKHFGSGENMNNQYSGTKYEVEEEILCPLHGRQIIRKEFPF